MADARSGVSVSDCEGNSVREVKGTFASANPKQSVSTFGASKRPFPTFGAQYRMDHNPIKMCNNISSEEL